MFSDGKFDTILQVQFVLKHCEKTHVTNAIANCLKTFEEFKYASATKLQRILYISTFKLHI